MAEDTGAPNGDGAPDGESKDTSKDDFVPKTQFLAALKSANEKYDALAAKFEAVAKDKVEAQKKYTRAELKAMVDSGQINQDQADAQIDWQTREDAKAEARGAAVEVVTAAQRKSYVDSEIARYKAIAPEILDETHEKRQRIVEEYQYLVGTLGDSNSVETQLKAIRSVLGPIEKLEKALSGRPAHESHRESGGSGAETRKKGGALTYDDLSSREKTHYDKLIASGTYKDRAAVNEELKYANATTRRKYGAMN